MISYAALGETQHFTSKEPLPDFDPEDLEEYNKVEELAKSRLTESTKELESVITNKWYEWWLFLLLTFQMAIAIFLQVCTYEMVVASDNAVDTMKDFTALYIINELDDIVGEFFKFNILQYTSYCRFKHINSQKSVG